MNYKNMFDDFMNIKHRGPDMSIFQTIKNVNIGFHRLAIMDPTFHANQPYIIEDGDRTIVFICNGEIYNYNELIMNYNLPINNNSDCMTIPQLYLKSVKYNPDGLNDVTNFVELFKRNIKGEFAFILLEFNKLQDLKQVVIGRDQIGIRPLYYHPITDESTDLLFSSEIKAMTGFNKNVSEFEPGTIYSIGLTNGDSINNIQMNDFKTVYNTLSYSPINSELEFENKLLEKIRTSVVNSITRRLTADKPIAFLLSGGVDSSLIAAISSKVLNKPINTFCCGMNEGTIYCMQEW